MNRDLISLLNLLSLLLSCKKRMFELFTHEPLIEPIWTVNSWTWTDMTRLLHRNLSNSSSSSWTDIPFPLLPLLVTMHSTSFTHEPEPIWPDELIHLLFFLSFPVSPLRSFLPLSSLRWSLTAGFSPLPFPFPSWRVKCLSSRLILYSYTLFPALMDVNRCVFVSFSFTYELLSYSILSCCIYL